MLFGKKSCVDFHFYELEYVDFARSRLCHIFPVISKFLKLSVHDGEDEDEGGCPLPEWKPCGCRERARRRQVPFHLY